MNDLTHANEAVPIDADAQARIEQLMYDLEHNPAVRCPISYNWHGNQELADKASIRIRLYGQLMREACPEISFSALNAITFHHDYELALQKQQAPSIRHPWLQRKPAALASA